MNINSALRQGMFFGINSGVITTTGVLVGLSQATMNPYIIIITIISLALSDGLGESYGIYISKKAEKLKDNSNNPFLSLTGLLIMKIIVVLSFLLPFLVSMSTKYFRNLVWPLGWGLFILTLMDYRLSKLRGEPIYQYLIPHYSILIITVILTKIFGQMIAKYSN